MQSHKIDWRSVTLAEFNDWLTQGLDTDKEFPFETWIISVDDVPMSEVDGKTRLEILPEVYDFLSELQATWIRYSTQRMNGAGSSSSASVVDTTKSSIET